MNKKYTVISSKTLYTHKRVQLIEDTIKLPNGEITDYLHYGNLPDCVTILVKDSNGKLLILNEYTYPADEYMYQLVGGSINANETPEQAAKRELLEEAGLIANSYELLGRMSMEHRRTKAMLYLYLATDLEQKASTHESEELIEPSWISEQEFTNLVKSGKLTHAGSLAAWAYYLNKKQTI